MECRAGYTILLFCTLVLTAEAARVLMLNPTGGKSQKNVFYGLASALTERGHEVVLFSGFKPSSPVKGVREVVPEKLAALFDDKKMPSQFEMNKQGMSAGFAHFRVMFAESPREALFSTELDQLMKQKFDLVVFGAFAYSLYFVPYAMKIPFILLAPVSYFPLQTSPMGTPLLPSLHPMVPQNATDKMSFMQRVQSAVGHVVMGGVMRHIFMPYCDGLVAEKYGKGAYPSAAEIERNASMLFLSCSEAFHYHQPLLPNTIRVGGMHCTKAKPLPKTLTRFLGGSEFVFFSMGSVARPEDMTKEQRSAILKGLGALPYKVLLKWNTMERTGIPSNILPSKWLPQQDLLGNSKCKLFISHGGFGSALESFCHGVPTLMMPVTGDQFINAGNALRMGVSRTLYWPDLSAESLVRKIQEATTPEVTEAARYRKSLFDSLPIPPRDLAVYWVEHVIAHGGAPHLRSIAADLYWFQYYSLDVLLFMLAAIYLVFKVVAMLLGCFCRCLCGRKVAKAEAPPKSESKSKKRVKKD